MHDQSPLYYRVITALVLCCNSTWLLCLLLFLVLSSSSCLYSALSSNLTCDTWVSSSATLPPGVSLILHCASSMHSPSALWHWPTSKPSHTLQYIDSHIAWNIRPRKKIVPRSSRGSWRPLAASQHLQHRSWIQKVPHRAVNRAWFIDGNYKIIFLLF